MRRPSVTVVEMPRLSAAPYWKPPKRILETVLLPEINAPSTPKNGAAAGQAPL